MVCVFITLSSCHPEKQDNTVRAEAIVNKYLHAIGGYEALQSIQSIIRVGTYIEPAYQLIMPARTINKRPNKRMIGFLEGPVAEGYDGQQTWELIEGELKITDTINHPHAVAASKRGAEFDESFIDAAKKNHRITYMGDSILEQKKVSILQVVLNDGWVKKYYFDQQTGLLIAYKKAMPIHARGNAVESITYVSGYTRVNGVLFPLDIIERNTNTGKLMSASFMDSIVVNPEIDDSIFRVPLISKKSTKS